MSLVSSGVDSPMRLKTDSPSLMCCQSICGGNSRTYMPWRPMGTLFRTQRAVLLDVSFVYGAIQLEDAIRSAERVHQRPVVDMLDGVVGTVVRAPAREAEQVIALVEVLGVEDFAGLGVGAGAVRAGAAPIRERAWAC